MRVTRLLEVFCVAFCAAALALPARAEPAGKVLTAGGDVLVLRGSEILRLSGGAAIESGDQIHTGADGKALIVFTDSGLIWIRSNSDFVVDEYSYANGQGGRESAFFSLLKGGARSVTGLIGRRNRMSYRLRVSVATIGIRGTDFSVVMCQRDCKDSDGGLAAKGLYGEVLEGRIAVTPLDDRVLEREFAAGEFFYLADERSAPTPLFLPPPFLRSKADEQARLIDQTGIVIAPGSPGAASGPALSNLIGGPSGGPMNGLTETLTDLTEILTKGWTGSNTGGLGTGIASALVPVLNTIGGITTPVVNTVGGIIAPVTNTVGGITAPVVNTVGGIIAPVTNTVGSITAPVTNTVGSITAPVTNTVGSITAPVTNTVGSTLSTVTPLVAPVTAPVVSTVAPVATPIAAPVVSTVAPVVTLIAAPVVSTVAPVVIPIAAPAPSISLPGTISTPLPIGLS